MRPGAWVEVYSLDHAKAIYNGMVGEVIGCEEGGLVVDLTRTGENVIPTYNLKICETQRCPSGHDMQLSEYAHGNYTAGWACDSCRGLGTGSRWYCVTCQHDRCLNCTPPPNSTGDDILLAGETTSMSKEEELDDLREQNKELIRLMNKMRTKLEQQRDDITEYTARVTGLTEEIKVLQEDKKTHAEALRRAESLAHETSSHTNGHSHHTSYPSSTRKKPEGTLPRTNKMKGVIASLSELEDEISNMRDDEFLGAAMRKPGGIQNSARMFETKLVAIAAITRSARRDIELLSTTVVGSSRTGRGYTRTYERDTSASRSLSSSTRLSDNTSRRASSRGSSPSTLRSIADKNYLRNRSPGSVSSRGGGTRRTDLRSNSNGSRRGRDTSIPLRSSDLVREREPITKPKKGVPLNYNSTANRKRWG
eukprot:TRINITY_DN22327_c0_g1_i1.p1 TRINITY_DN22327_c0_g1~~TRINITY_DN22327_c0_g1_i1.p1  ORF type:complete len:422 (+),score=58.20 TRINITY_DN22327_c0_g1_i1:47-1312(+)